MTYINKYEEMGFNGNNIAISSYDKHPDFDEIIRIDEINKLLSLIDHDKKKVMCRLFKMNDDNCLLIVYVRSTYF